VLQLAGPQDGAVAQAVAVLQRAFQDVGDDLHVPVPVHPEALAGLPVPNGVVSRAFPKAAASMCGGKNWTRSSTS